MIFVTQDVSMCDELSIKYNSHQDQVLGIWVILASKHVRFISCMICSPFACQLLCLLLAKDVVLSELASCEQKACSTATRNMLDASAMNA
jgi:hypothetical protein